MQPNFKLTDEAMMEFSSMLDTALGLSAAPAQDVTAPALTYEVP